MDFSEFFSFLILLIRYEEHVNFLKKSKVLRKLKVGHTPTNLVSNTSAFNSSECFIIRAAHRLKLGKIERVFCKKLDKSMPHKTLKREHDEIFHLCQTS